MSGLPQPVGCAAATPWAVTGEGDEVGLGDERQSESERRARGARRTPQRRVLSSMPIRSPPRHPTARTAFHLPQRGPTVAPQAAAPRAVTGGILTPVCRLINDMTKRSSWHRMTEPLHPTPTPTTPHRPRRRHLADATRPPANHIDLAPLHPTTFRHPAHSPMRRTRNELRYNTYNAFSTQMAMLDHAPERTITCATSTKPPSLRHTLELQHEEKYGAPHKHRCLCFPPRKRQSSSTRGLLALGAPARVNKVAARSICFWASAGDTAA